MFIPLLVKYQQKFIKNASPLLPPATPCMKSIGTHSDKIFFFYRLLALLFFAPAEI